MNLKRDALLCQPLSSPELKKYGEFVGIITERDKYYVIFPLGYKLKRNAKDDELKKEIRNVLETIALTRKNYTHDLNNSLGNGNTDLFFSFYYLITDYLQYGLYRPLSSLVNLYPTGKIQWKKTVQGKKLITDKSIYFEDIYFKTISKSKNIVTALETSCLHKAQKIIGWLFSNFNLPKISINESSLKNYIPFLKAELSRTYDDRGKNILQSMLIILEQTSDSNRQTCYYFGTDSYHCVWEYILKKVYGKGDEKDFFPQGKYHLKKHGESSGSKLRPDFLYIDESKHELYIIDAKYYKYAVNMDPNCLPNTSSLSKQIIYAEANYKKETLKDYSLYNAFLLPGEDVAYLGYGYIESSDKSFSSSHSKIHLVSLNTKTTIENFLNSKNRGSELAFLIRDNSKNITR